MKDIIKPRKEVVLLLIYLLPAIFLLILWKKLPDKIPSHWNIHGEVDNYSAPYFPAIMSLGLYLLMLLLPFIDPRKRNYLFFAKAWYSIRLLLGLFFSVITISIYYYAMGVPLKMDRIVVAGVLLIFIVLGNFMGKLRPNWFIGIRTPWTLDNETVWIKTHRLGGAMWFWGGLVLLLLSFVLPLKIFLGIMVPVFVAITLVPVIYSWWLFREIKKNGQE